MNFIYKENKDRIEKVDRDYYFRNGHFIVSVQQISLTIVFFVRFASIQIIYM